jgi:hypothetical protein
MLDRKSFDRSVMLGLALLASSAMSGRADETFVCEDGSSVTIDDDNRAAMQEHPCVKAWFDGNRARRDANAGSGAAVQPVLRRSTLNRAAAMRDLQSRPAYLAWSRPRTGQSSTGARTGGTSAGAPVGSPPTPRLGVTIVVPASRR